MMKVLILLVALAASAQAAALCPSGYKLLWNDEFSTVASLKKWNYELYNGCEYDICGWGNKELEWYRNSTDNVNVALGNLVITARASTDADKKKCCVGKCKPNQCQFTSGRIRTYGKFATSPSTKTGSKVIRIAARMKLPVAEGLWPAFWLLPEASPKNCSGCGVYGPWPQSGAITVAQAVNKMVNMTGGLAYGGEWPNATFSNYNTILKQPDQYHEYALEWSRTEMTWLIDGKVVHTARSAQGGKVKDGWYTTGPDAGIDSPFDKNFHLILNLAVGGTGPGNLSAATIKKSLKTPKSMRVDYIRVCKK